MPDPSLETQPEEYYGEPPISLSHIFGVVRRYSGVIVVSLAAAAMAYLIVAAAVYLFSARQKLVSLPFRLEFKGASEGKYPNDLKFSIADVVATPVLLDVYNANGLSRFTSFDRFGRSVYVLESNPQLERLANEYASKLADTRLTPVDRDRIEREFDAKRASISKSEYALQYVPAATDDIPSAVISKALSDILANWSRRAAIEKKALDYQVAVISPTSLDKIVVTDGEYLVPLLLLRQRLNDAILNAKAMELVPGAKLVRIASNRQSITDVEAHLDEILRFRVEPLIPTAFRMSASSTSAMEVARAELAYDQRTLDAAQARETALRNVLVTYESQARSPREGTTPQAVAQGQVPPAGSRPGIGETIMPQLSDSFIDRIADLTSRNADRGYRQQLTDQIKEAALAAVPVQAAVKYDQELLQQFQRGTAGPQPNPAQMKQQWGAAVAEVREAITDLNAIYILASRQLYPETEMYRVTGPAVTRIDRAVSPTRLLLYGILTLLVAFPVILVLVFVHNRVREEEVSEHPARQHAATL